MLFHYSNELIVGIKKNGKFYGMILFFYMRMRNLKAILLAQSLQCLQFPFQRELQSIY